MERSLSRLRFALKAANWAMASAIAAAGGTLFFASLACMPPTQPESALDSRDSLAVLAILEANGLGWPKGRSPVARDSTGHATSLYLPGLGLQTIPADIGELVHLTYIDLGRNELRRLPQEFEALTALEHLDLSSNRFDSLPDGFTLARLKELYLSGNRLTDLPRNVDVSGLIALEADSNLIPALPPDFRYLRQLTSFSMRGNRLDSLPGSFNPENHPHLRRLNLSGNRLASLPAGLEDFSFEYLDLGNNRLCLPDSAGADSTQQALLAWLGASDRDWRSSQRCP